MLSVDTSQTRRGDLGILRREELLLGEVSPWELCDYRGASLSDANGVARHYAHSWPEGDSAGSGRAHLQGGGGFDLKGECQDWNKHG